MPTTVRAPRLLLVPVLLLVGIAATACGNAVTAEVIGSAGVTVDAQGEPVVLVTVCQDDIDSIDLVGGRGGLEPDEPNPTIASWTAGTPQHGTITLSLGAPGAPWEGPALVELEDPELYVVSADRSGADAEVTQASFRGRDLAALSPDQVIVRDGTVVTRAAFDAEACA